MSLILGCIADDYTGASDLANTLTRAGLATVQTIGVPRGTLDLAGIDAVVVALKSRSIAAADAVAQSRKARDWLTSLGTPRVLFKICSTFDSTPDGNIGPVAEALRDDTGGGVVVVTPAFPQTGRTVFMGHLFVGAMPLHESPLKDHPLNPMHDSNLVRVLARQSSSGVGLIERSVVACGADAVRARLDALRAEGKTLAIADAVEEEDIETLGLAVLGAPLSVGASGLGLGLARALARSGQGRAGNTAVFLSPSGYSAAIAGSCSHATLEQIAEARAHMPVHEVDPVALVRDGAAEIARALDVAREKLASGPLIIASSASAEAVRSVQEKLGRAEAGEAIERGLAEIAAGLVALGVRRLVVAGGETSGAAIDRLDIPAFRVGQEIAPGVPVLSSIGGEEEQMLFALKSGNFGGRDFFRKAFAAMTGADAAEGLQCAS